MDVSEVSGLQAYADAFPFDEFNRMQRTVMPALLERDDNVVASAPTASGKTALAELAICKALDQGGTALFIAPLRALTNEKESDWDRFEALGHSVYVVTGERELNSRRAELADILVMTPEKLDSATRKYDSERYGFITDVDVCVIDEVHLLDSDRRGSVLEVTIARLRRLCDPRIVALSATMPNVEDVADWLDAPTETTFRFDSSYRPVPLSADVQTYSRGENAFADKYRRLYRCLDLARPHLRDGGQTLVFVASRLDTVRSAEKASEELDGDGLDLGDRGEYDRHTDASELDNETLRTLVLDGIAFHHAGLSRSDRNLVESWFREGAIDLLFSTSTLAWGVNLPARCVIIRDTKLHDPLEGEVSLSPIDVLQMLGRAGRPGYDDEGFGWVICPPEEADGYRTLLEDGKPIESRLADTLTTHLNAEIAMGTVRDIDDAVDWIETTFYHTRAQRAPDRYDLSDHRRLIRRTVDDLADAGFVEVTDDGSIEPTTAGSLTSTYYLRHETARHFLELCDHETISEHECLDRIASAAEFDSVSTRRAERDAIDAVLATDSAPPTVTGNRKVYAILSAAMAGSIPSALRSDAWAIKQNATRLLSALGRFLDRFHSPAASNTACRLEHRIEHGVGSDVVELTTIDGVGSGRAGTLATAGIRSVAELRGADPSSLERVGLSESVANRLVEHARDLPAFEIDWESIPESIERDERVLEELRVENHGGPERVGIRMTINGNEMTTRSTYLRSEAAVPVAIYGGDGDELTFAVTVVTPELPLRPITEERTVTIR